MVCLQGDDECGFGFEQEVTFSFCFIPLRIARGG
jgi:hypothetical protein